MNLAFLAPQFLWALLALPLIVLLHFLRTRRKPLVVSALFLWQRARSAADSRRRFSATWLLLLQLLFACLAALALARPAVSFQGPPDRVIVIDASASMAARDSDGVRIDKAKGAAERLLVGAGRAAVVRAGIDARVVESLSSDGLRLRAALDAVEPGDRSVDLVRAIDLARSIAPEGEIHLISDSEPPTGSFDYHNVAGDGLNYGITTFDIGIGQAYLAVSSNDPRPQQLSLALFDGEREVASTSLLVPAGGRGSVTFPLVESTGFLEARLTVPEGDALALDDVAFAGQRELTVVVGERSSPVIRALQALPGVTVGYSPDAAEVGTSARVLFGYDGDTLPPGDNLLFAAPAEEPEYSSIRDWNGSDELLRFVDLRNTVVGLAPSLEGQAEEGWEVLARTGDLRPVITRRDEGSDTTVRVHFHPSQTDLVLRPAFPTFIANVVAQFRGVTTVPLGSSLVSIGEASERRWVLEPGIYETPEGPVAASLLATGETLLPGPSPTRQSATEGDRLERTEVTRSIWLILILVAAALLLAEWFFWSRGGTPWLRSS